MEIFELDTTGFNKPSYADSITIIGPLPGGTRGGLFDCNDKKYSGLGPCVEFAFRDPSTKKQLGVATVRSITPGEYSITAKRSGYKDGTASRSISSAEEDQTINLEVLIVDASVEGVPTIDDLGIIPRGTNVNFLVSGLTSKSYLLNRYALEVIDEGGNKFDCQEVRKVSDTKAAASLRTPSETTQSTMTLNLYKTNTKLTSTLACDDIAGQSPLDSKTMSLTAVAGSPSGLYRYDSSTNSCIPDSAGESKSECEKKITTIAAATATPPPPFAPCKQRNADGTCEIFETGVGDIYTDPMQFMRNILTVLLSLSGGIAMLIIIFAGYRYMTAAGDQAKLQGAKEMLTSAVVGLLFMIFSLVLLQVIGVDILHLPGFGP